MAPLLHCVRHAQGFHNLSLENLALHDPGLTPRGEQQCAALASSFASHSRISLIIASPLLRTIQTALLAFQATLSNGQCMPLILALPQAQETSNLISDTGSDLGYLEKMFRENNWPVDLSLVDENWNVKTLGSKWAPTYDAISKRAKDARAFIWKKVQQLQESGQESPEILFVTHGGYLHYFTEDWDGSGVDQAVKAGQFTNIRWDIPGTAWRNAEIRTYTFQVDPVDSDIVPQLVETTESRGRRGNNRRTS